jgi:hypothetical protein
MSRLDNVANGIHKARPQEYLILPNRHVSVSLKAMEDQVLINRIEKDVNVQLPARHVQHP